MPLLVVLQSVVRLDDTTSDGPVNGLVDGVVSS